jgi:uncharacterized membrane protein
MPISYVIQDWLAAATRWAHVFAAIMWVGQTYFFTWLDHTFHNEKQVWMVHSGGFYIVDKQKEPKLLDQTLHWFRWEAAFTWMSGVLLLILVYYAGGLMLDDEHKLLRSVPMAVVASVAMIIIGWIIYDLMWISPLARNEIALNVISYVLLVGAIYASSKLFAPRAAYMQTGAMLGTFMAANVWMRILPAQRQLIAATKTGQAPDMRLAERAKHRSKHNTFIVLPVVFIMLNFHMPTVTFGYHWIALAVTVLIGWAVAAVIRKA